MAAGNINQIKELLWKNHHVKVRKDWLEACTQFLIDENQGTFSSPAQLSKLVYQQWLVGDLREIGVPFIANDLAECISTTIQGPLCLQINLIINVGDSAYSQIQKLKGLDDPESFHEKKSNWEATKPTRMLIFELTDGVNNVMGMEYRPIANLKSSTPPGTKIKVLGKVICHLGCLLLTSQNVELIGGEVDSLKEENSAWNLLHRAINQEPPEVPLHLVKPELTNDCFVEDMSHSEDTLLQNGQSRDNARNAGSENTIVNKRKIRNVQGTMRNDSGSFSCNGEVSRSKFRAQKGTVENPFLVIDDDSNNENDNLIEDYIESEDDFDIDALDRIEEVARIPNPQQLQDVTDENVTFGSHNTDNLGPLPGDLNVEDLYDDGIFDDDFERVATEVECQEGQQNHIANNSSTTSDMDDDGELCCAVQPKKRRNVNSTDFQTKCDKGSVRYTASGELVTKCLDHKKSRQQQTVTEREAIQSRLSASVQPVRREIATTLIDEDMKFTPFCYLADIPQVNTKRVIRVKAYIATIVSHSQSTRPDWQVTVKLNDGTAVMDADISNKEVLTKLLGFPVAEFRLEMEEACTTADPNVRQRFCQRISDFQANLTSVSSLMDLKLSPHTPRPSILKIIEPTVADVTALLDRVTNKLLTRY